MIWKYNEDNEMNDKCENMLMKCNETIICKYIWKYNERMMWESSMKMMKGNDIEINEEKWLWNEVMTWWNCLKWLMI